MKWKKDRDRGKSGKNEIETEDLCTYGKGLRILERSEQKNLKKQINDGSDSGRRNQNKIKTWNAMISISLMIRREKDHIQDDNICNRTKKMEEHGKKDVAKYDPW